MKKAQDFLVDTTLGDKKFDIKETAQPEEEKIVLSIKEGTVPVSVLKDAGRKAQTAGGRKVSESFRDVLGSVGKPNPKDKATFFRLLSIMINAGIPLIRSLETIGDQTVNRRLKGTIFSIARDIEKGGTLSVSMGHFPEIFSDSHTGMIKAGEASGQLNQILKQLAIEVEKAASISRKVRGALMYPVIIFIVMIAVVVVMMVVVVPKISEIFSTSGQTLPLVTRIVIGISNFMQHQWIILVLGIIGLVIGGGVFRRTKKGKFVTDWLLIKMPLFGILLQKSILARFSRSLGNLLSSGVPIIQGLQINARGLGNAVYRRRVELASEDLSRGIPLAESLRDCSEFPSMMVQMISVGEQTAQLDTISQKIAEYYEDEVDTAVNSISKVIEPIIMVFLGIVVGGIIAAVMLPIIQLTQNSGSL